uniref:Uncharacterized protein n=1 Tax=Aegilops tauschii subsp. strangulata TaxID=200361 RepID=A0A453NDN6_AEGTS
MSRDGVIHYGCSDGCLFSVLSNWVLLVMLCLCSQCLSFHIWGCVQGCKLCRPWCFLY